MPPSPRRDTKADALRQRGSPHPRPQAVRDPLFASGEFFDRRDLVQVKYEMVRRVRVDGQAVSHSARVFGFSRPAFYHAQSALADGGLAALVPKKPGPRRAHKLSADVMAFLMQRLSEEPALRTTELAEHVQARFGRAVHLPPDCRYRVQSMRWVNTRRRSVAQGSRPDARGGSGPAGWAWPGAAGTIAARQPAWEAVTFY